MNAASFKTKFRIFKDLENVVNFGDSNDTHLISTRILQKEKRIELYEAKSDSPCITAKQLFDYLKSLKGCDEFALLFIPIGGGEWSIDRVSQRPKNGVVYLDCNAEISD